MSMFLHFIAFEYINLLVLQNKYDKLMMNNAIDVEIFFFIGGMFQNNYFHDVCPKPDIN